jgi:ABC-2 type transport system ATP-binding protein
VTPAQLSNAAQLDPTRPGRSVGLRAKLARHKRRWQVLAAVLVLASCAVVVTAVLSRSPAIATRSQFVLGTPEPVSGQPAASQQVGTSTAVRLDTTLYLPASTPAPAVLLAHGFGGTKTDLVSQARELARNGYVVLTFTARGFGGSGGLVHLDALSYEIADGSRLIDYLARQPEVLQRNGTPVVGVAGSSYGGAFALMLGAADHRVDAVAADITWNNLAAALFPNDQSDAPQSGTAQSGTAQSGTAATADRAGVFKKLWVGYLFSLSRPGTSGPPAAGTTAGCGRFAADICRLYQQASASVGGAAGKVNGADGNSYSAEQAALLRQSSPATVLSQLKAPTLLIQGEQDSLFPLSEADANARQIRAAGAPLQVRWRAGGHDASSADDPVGSWERQFFDQKLRGKAGGNADGSFLLAQRDAGLSASTGKVVNKTLRAVGGYPGPTAGSPTAVIPTAGTPQAGAFSSGVGMPLTGPRQVINAPPGGNPAAVTSLPALGNLLSAASAAGVSAVSGLSQIPGQVAVFSTAPLSHSTLITGSSTVRLEVAATGSRGAGAAVSASLFVSLRDVSSDGTTALPANLVAPIAVSLPADGAARTISVELPWIVADIPAGHRLVVVVSTTDFSYSMPAAPAAYTVALAGSLAVGSSSGLDLLAVPSLRTEGIRSGTVWWWPITAGIVVLLSVAFALWRLRSRRRLPSDSSLAEVPVAVIDLVKSYSDGYRAVDGLSFQVERGQVLGLLGPNGAGKTTTLRVLMGLIMPTSGTVRVFGEEVVPGAAVLSALGAFVEGPGLLPHLSGRDNLDLYWAASGRPAAAAGFDVVLEIAGLGSSLDRRVKTYSHGMQQRLAIAQAMLGLPEVLILDEPTNGLDPPQIAEMREVLRRYAATGRTVIVSSHLLAEVEQTCTHVVVMANGRLVASGSVAEVAGAAIEQLVVKDPELALDVLAAAGIAAHAVPARRALEDVFLDLIGDRQD